MRYPNGARIALAVLSACALFAHGQAGPRRLRIAPADPPVAAGLTLQLSARLSFFQGSKKTGGERDISTNVVWLSLDPSVATVDAGGMVHALAAGTARITVARGPLRATTTVHVPTAVLAGLTISPSAPSLPKGAVQQFTATAHYSDQSTLDASTVAAWSSSIPAVATISPDGLSQAVSASGSTVITASYGGFSASTTLNAAPAALASLLLSPSSVQTYPAHTQQFKALGIFTDGSTFDYTGSAIWSSSIPAVATINASGLATAVAQGTTSIRAMVSGISGSVGMSVFPPVKVTISPSSASPVIGTTQKFAATVSGTDDTLVTWAVNAIPGGNTVFGTIDANGLYTAPVSVPAPSSFTVTATSLADNLQSGTAMVSVIQPAGPFIITGLDRPSAMPMALMTIQGSGFIPNVPLYAKFSDGLGYSWSSPAVSITPTQVQVSVPPYIIPYGDLSTGTVGVQLTQGGQSSNTVGGFQILDLPTPASKPGTATLAYLIAARNFSLTMSNNLFNASFYDLEMDAALRNLRNGLEQLIPMIQAVWQNPGQSFAFATISGQTVSVTSADLARMDRIIMGMLAAQAGATYSSARRVPTPLSGTADCQAQEAGAMLADLRTNPNVVPANYDPAQAYFNNTATAVPCQVAAAVTGSLTVVTAAGGAMLGGLALFVAADALALPAAAILSVGIVAGAGLIAVGGGYDQLQLNGTALIQAGDKILTDLLKDAALDKVLGFAIGDKLNNLYNLLKNSYELHHAFDWAPPYNGGTPTGTTFNLFLSTTGFGGGTVSSYPGGIVCGSAGSACSNAYPAGTSVTVTAQPDANSTFNGFVGACSGSGCTVVMNSDLSVTADFEPVPPPPNPIVYVGPISGSVQDLGHGNCPGTASLSGTITIQVSPVSGGYSYSGNAVLNQGAGICDYYSGGSFSGFVSTLNGGAVSFYFGPAFATGTFNGPAFSGSFSFSVNLGPDVGTGTLTATQQ